MSMKRETDLHIPLATTQITLNNNTNSNNKNNTNNDENDDIPLADKILSIIRSNNLIIRPATLSTALGISIDEANAELCGLLSAVGSTATFHFEMVGNDDSTNINGNATPCTRTSTTTTIVQGPKTNQMVFTFPKDFEQKANTYVKKQQAKLAMNQAMDTFIKYIKVIVAFGLILSLCILIIAGICGMIVILVAMSRGDGGGGGGGSGQRHMSRHIRSLIFTLRELLWFYALFGPDIQGDTDDEEGGGGGGATGGGDPFLREVAQTIAMTISLCFTSPTNIWFWFRMRNLQRQQHVFRQRGWRFDYQSQRNNNNNEDRSALDHSYSTSSSHNLDGSNRGEGRRGILSIAVEFLFGTTPFYPGPTDVEKWKIRQQAIILHSSSPPSTSTTLTEALPGLSLAQLVPFADYPPPSISSQPTSSHSVSTVMNIISHFNGIPVVTVPNTSLNKNGDDNLLSTRFAFPELVAEAQDCNISSFLFQKNDGEEDDDSWDSFWYKTDSSSDGGVGGYNRNIPMHENILYERRHVLTKLSKQQFHQCCFLNIMNMIGILMLQRSIMSGGVLEITNTTFYSCANGLLLVLAWYAKLFFLLPLLRMIIILVLNWRIEERNRRRLFIVGELSNESTTL